MISTMVFHDYPLPTFQSSTLVSSSPHIAWLPPPQGNEVFGVGGGIILDWGNCRLSKCWQTTQGLLRWVFGLLLLNTPAHLSAPWKQSWHLRVFKLLNRSTAWVIKHLAQENWALFPFNNTEWIPCFSFPLYHRRMQCCDGLFPGSQFKEKINNSMNSPWRCCRGLLTFTHLQDLSSNKGVSPG